VLIENFIVEADHLPPGEGIEMAAKRIRLGCDLGGRTPAGTFEEGMLDKMGQAVPVESFMTGTGTQENAKADGSNMLHPLRGNDQSVIQ